MSIYQQTKKTLKRSADALNKVNEHKGVRKIKRITIVIFALLIILDVIFVLPNPFPTFSRTVLDSSPKFMFIIWFWGIMTANIFFPRKVKNMVRLKIIGSVLIVFISAVLLYTGNHVYTISSQLDCDNLQSRTPPILTEIICRDEEGTKIDCVEMAIKCDYTKYDITTSAKLGLLIFGFVFGYFFWPQVERAPDIPTQ